MTPQTLTKATEMLARILEQDATYTAAGASHGLARSTVERMIKALVLRVLRDDGIAGLDEAAVASLARLKQCRQAVMEAVRAYRPRPPVARTVALGPQDIALGASRVRARSDNASRDVALIYVLLSTGAKPLEIARLEVRDYLRPDGSVRRESEMRAAAAVRGCARPLYFTSVSACAAVDDYLAERCRKGLGTGRQDEYRGLDPESGLFLTQGGHRFQVKARGPDDPRPTCRLMIATYRLIFARAGWQGMTAQSARRAVARRLVQSSGRHDQVATLLGLAHCRAARSLLGDERRPLASLAGELA